jgi:hypothetical protein
MSCEDSLDDSNPLKNPGIDNIRVFVMDVGSGI